MWLNGSELTQGVVEQPEEQVGRSGFVDQGHAGTGQLSIGVIDDGELPLDVGETAAQTADELVDPLALRCRQAVRIGVPEDRQCLSGLEPPEAQLTDEFDEREHRRVDGIEGSNGSMPLLPMSPSSSATVKRS